MNGILKDELLQEVYTNFTTEQEVVSKAISVYNHLRPHSSISYKTPAELHSKNEEMERKWKRCYVKRKIVKVDVAAEMYR